MRGAKQNKESTGFIASTTPAQPQPVEGELLEAKAETGMEEMSRIYDEGGRELYIGAGDRERD